jgi:hypothetical protein
VSFRITIFPAFWAPIGCSNITKSASWEIEDKHLLVQATVMLKISEKFKEKMYSSDPWSFTSSDSTGTENINWNSKTSFILHHQVVSVIRYTTERNYTVSKIFPFSALCQLQRFGLHINELFNNSGNEVMDMGGIDHGLFCYTAGDWVKSQGLQNLGRHDGE